MNTSATTIQKLQQALATTKEATDMIENLIATHDYQDVAALVSQAAATLLESAILMMQSEDEAALEAIEAAEDYIEAIYDIIEGDIED